MTDQANSFNVLMEMIWEGGAAYDLTIERGDKLESAHDATAMCAALFPAAWEKRTRVESETGDYWIVNFRDGSQAIIYLDGSGVEYSTTP